MGCGHRGHYKADSGRKRFQVSNPYLLPLPLLCFQAVLDKPSTSTTPSPRGGLGLGNCLSLLSFFPAADHGDVSMRPGTPNQPPSVHPLAVFWHSATEKFRLLLGLQHSATSLDPQGPSCGAEARYCARCEIIPAREQSQPHHGLLRAKGGRQATRPAAPQPLHLRPAVNNANRTCGLNKAMA